MTGEIEAFGDLIVASGVADSLGASHNKIPVQGVCANCSAHMDGNFCGVCGQKARVHRSLAHVGEELLHGITHFDGKAWTTIPMLLFRPGQLTRDYIEGKRVRYIAPVPMFLLVVFLMFFVFSFVHITDNRAAGMKDIDGNPMTQVEVDNERVKVNARLAQLDRDIAEAVKGPNPEQIVVLKGLRTEVKSELERLNTNTTRMTGSPTDIPSEIAREIQTNNPRINLGNQSLNEKAALALRNPELVLYKIQGKAYKLSFLLVPMSLPWLWLMFFWKRKFRMYDHAIFALYSISFMSLLFILGSGGLALGIDTLWFWVPLILAPLVHMYVHLKGTYEIGTLGALWRTVALWFGAVITLSLYAVFMITLGVLD
jgi:hypothetical protein